MATTTKRERRINRELGRVRLYLSNGELPIDGLATPKTTFGGDKKKLNLFTGSDHFRVSDPNAGIVQKVEFSDSETRSYAELVTFRTAFRLSFGEDEYAKMRKATRGS